VNHDHRAPGVDRHTSPLVSRTIFEVVPPGETLHMLAGLWTWIAVYTSSNDNQMTAGYVELSYQSWPMA